MKVQICNFSYSVEKGFSINNVSAFVLVKIKQICSKQSLILKIFFLAILPIYSKQSSN
jgi:hypothetical protein